MAYFNMTNYAKSYQIENVTKHTEASKQAMGRASGSRCMARLRATGTDLGTSHKNNIRWMTVVTSD